VNSQWTPDFRKDASVAYIKYNGTAAPNGKPFPEIYVNGVTRENRWHRGRQRTDRSGTNYSYQLKQSVHQRL